MRASQCYLARPIPFRPLPRARYVCRAESSHAVYFKCWGDALENGRAALASVGAAALVFMASPAEAADAVAVGSCLLRSCQLQLAQCIADADCLTDLVCIQKCQGRPDEVDCEIRCGNQYEDQAVAVFNACAVSDKQCVPQIVTNDAYPVPDDSVLDDTFDLSQFQGRWYITAGYNQLFDTFDCQEHYFTSPEPGKLFGKIQWRIQRPFNSFLERSTIQRFVQDPEHPSKLSNRGNEYLHYEDDWKPEEYAFIYYKGNNDAWRGYGGATVYTRAASFPSEYAPVMQEAAAAVGLKWSDFTLTDNSCPEPVPFQKFLATRVQRLGMELEKDLESFGRGFTVIRDGVPSRAQSRTMCSPRIATIPGYTAVLTKYFRAGYEWRRINVWMLFADSDINDDPYAGMDESMASELAAADKALDKMEKRYDRGWFGLFGSRSSTN